MNFNLILLLISLPCLVIYQGCSESQFSAISSSEKLSTLENHSGLGSDSTDDLANTGDDGLGSTNNNTNDNGTNSNQMGGLVSIGGVLMPLLQQIGNGTTAPPKQIDGGTTTTPPKQVDVGTNNNPTPNNTQFDNGEDLITDPTLGRFNVIRWCRGRDSGATLKSAKDIKIIVRDRTKKTAQCEGSGVALLNQILSTGQVDIPNCNFSNIYNKNMIVEVKNEKGETLSDGPENSTASNAFNDGIVKSDDGRSKFASVAIHLLLDRDINGLAAKNCDAYNSSPLVVDMRSSKELKSTFELSEPTAGVDFDILGLNSYPSAHTPKRISWVKDPRIMPIVLPQNGSVNGINELFGDNTLGPDNEFSDNGFAALAKYDGLISNTNTYKKRDGYITKKDEVYFKLRVWYDKNLNGIAESSELYTLQKAGVEIIDLKFDPHYYSRDQFGNEIKYKSVVKLKNGQLKPVFDIWFAVNNLIQK